MDQYETTTGEDEPTAAEAQAETDALEAPATLPVAATWAGLRVTFRTREPQLGNEPDVPTITALEDIMEMALEKAFGDDFEIRVSGAERTDR